MSGLRGVVAVGGGGPGVRRRDQRGGRMELGGRQAEFLAELDQPGVGIEPEESLGVGREIGEALVEVFQQGVAGELVGLVLAVVLVPDAAFDAARQPIAATPDGDGLRIARGRLFGRLGLRFELRRLHAGVAGQLGLQRHGLSCS
jgi:hypothetical protein